MRKRFLIFLFLIFLIGCIPPEEEPITQTLQDLIDSITIETQVTVNLTLPESYLLNDEVVFAIWESSDPTIIAPNGEVTRTYYDQPVTLTLELITLTDSVTTTYDLIVVSTGVEAYIQGILSLLTVPSETMQNINLQRSITYGGSRWTIVWTSSHNDILSSEGAVALVDETTIVTLTATITYEETPVAKEFIVSVVALSLAEKVDYVFDNITLPATTSQDLFLPTTFLFALTGTWESSHPQYLSHDGIISTSVSGRITVTLTLTLNTSDRRTFDIMVSQYGHLFTDRTFEGAKDNVIVVDGKLELATTATTGTYTTDVIETLHFNEAVASWAATSSTTATAELLIRVRVDGVWSRYFSYGEWGLGLQNKSYNASDTVARLSADEIMVQNSKTANALQMQMVLRRTTMSTTSAKVTLLAVALNIPSYTFPVDISSIRTSVDYDVPKLYQHIVPSIGGIICSPTSSTMLLKYKGHNFSDKADYEHQYISAVVREYNSGIYGNWTYNTVGISAFGETSYVMRMYSYQELLYHLDTVGPVSVSVRGTLIGELVRTWTTNGHLIIVRGYRFEGDQLYILANDPNLSPVYEEYKIENFLTFWRNIAYIVE